MSHDFEKHATRGKEIVRFVAEELEVPADKAGSIMRAVLHALRNRLTHEESFQLLAQLPMALKGMYVDGWKYDKDFNRINHVNDFVEEVRLEDEGLSGYDFDNYSKAMDAVAVLFKALNYYVSENEMNAIMGVMPTALKKFINDTIAGEGTVL